MLQGALLHLLAGLDELDRRHALQLVAEVVAHGRLQHLVDQVGDRAHHADHARGRGVGHVDLHDQLDAEDEAFAALGHDLRQPLVELVGLADRLRPVEAQDGRGHELGLVAARVDGVLAGPQRLLPDAAMAGPDDRAELERRPGRVFGRQADVGLDDRHLALLDDQHRHLFDPHQERVEQVGPVEQRIVLQADLAAGLQEGVEVLVVVVLRPTSSRSGPR